MSQKDQTLENLLELDEVRFVIDEHLGLWVKFEVKQVAKTKDRPHGVRYSLTMHDRSNARIMGFDNAHAVEMVGKTRIAKANKTCDHWHRDSFDRGRPYHYVTAGKLIEDFWKEVDKMQKKIEETKK